MRRAALAALLSHWRARPLQLASLVVGLALATALWTGVQAINAEARASYASAAGALGASRPVIENETGLIPQVQYVALRRAGWQVTPVLEGWISAHGGRVRLIGFDPLTAPADIAATGEIGNADLGAFLGREGRLIVSARTADRLTRADLPPLVVSEHVAPGMAFTDIGTAQGLLGLEGRISHLIVLDAQPLTRRPLEEAAPGLVLRASGGAADLARLTDSFHLNLTAFGFLSFAVGLFIVHGTIGLAFEQRRPLFRTLRALGLPGRTLTGLAGVELLVFALVSGVIGTVLGYLIAAVLIPDVAATLRGLYGVPVEGGLTLRLSWWLAGMGIAVLGTAIAGAGTVWKLASLPVLAPARPRAWALSSQRTIRAQATTALLLGAMALGLIAFGSGLVAGFAMLGALLLAAALALPSLLALALRVGAASARGPVTEWFWADTRQQLPGLSLALMALLIALAANIGVGTMVSSFRLTFTGWLDQRLSSELFVTARDEDEARRLTDWLVPRTDAILPIWDIDVEVMGAPARIYGVADHQTYRDHWPMLDALPSVWEALADGRMVLVNEQLARRNALAPGDPITLPGGWDTTVGGIYSDYGNPDAQVIIGVGELTRRFPDADRLSFGLRVSPEQAPALARAIVEEFGLPPEKLTDQASIKDVSLAVFERTFTVTGALNVLTLAVAGFAILTSLLTLAAMRLPQLAPAWAMGLTRRDLAWLELMRALLLALITSLAAVPVGLILAWVLLAVINVEAFGWRLPMYPFPGQWLRLVVLAILAAGLAALWPALRLTRIGPSALLKVFTHER